MRQGLLINCGVEGKAAERLHETAALHGVICRDMRDTKAVLRGLQKAKDAVVVVRIGRALEEELAMIQAIQRLHPETRTIALIDSDNPAIAALAWELGAAFVLSKPTPWEVLPDVVAAMLPEKVAIIE